MRLVQRGPIQRRQSTRPMRGSLASASNRAARCSVHTLKNRRNPLAHANAHRCQAVTAAPLAHLMKQGCHQPGTTTAEWMTERNSTAIDVQFVEIDTKFTRASEHLRCE